MSYKNDIIEAWERVKTPESVGVIDSIIENLDGKFGLIYALLAEVQLILDRDDNFYFSLGRATRSYNLCLTQPTPTLELFLRGFTFWLGYLSADTSSPLKDSDDPEFSINTSRIHI